MYSIGAFSVFFDRATFSAAIPWGFLGLSLRRLAESTRYPDEDGFVLSADLPNYAGVGSRSSS